MAIRHLHGCQYGSSPANHLHRESLIHYVEGGGEVLPMRTETSVISPLRLAVKWAILKSYKILFVLAECFEIHKQTAEDS